MKIIIVGLNPIREREDRLFWECVEDDGRLSN